jgi:hypothetical protein
MLTAQYLAPQTPAKNERENLIVKIRGLMHALRLIRAAWCTHVQIRQTPRLYTHISLLSPGACGTTQRHKCIDTCAECNGARMLK